MPDRYLVDQSTGGFVFVGTTNTMPMHHPTKYSSTQLNRGTCHPQTRARTHTHTTPHNAPSMATTRESRSNGASAASSQQEAGASLDVGSTPEAINVDDEDNNQTQALCAGVFCRLGGGFQHGGRLITGSWSSLSAAYAEMVMFLDGNIGHIPIEVQALSTEQALRAVPRRLSNPKAEVAALSAGEAGFAAEAGVDAACEEYAGEAESPGEEGVDAGYGDSAGEAGSSG